jgi:hypothetical protein
MSREPRPEPPRALPKVCRLLRTKTAFAVGAAGALWKLGESSTAVYWCLGTMESFGPDDGYCHPHQCGRGRACFEPDPRDDDDAHDAHDDDRA